MARKETDEKTHELSDQNLDQASGGGNVNQLWGDWFMPSEEAASENKLTDTADVPTRSEREDG